MEAKMPIKVFELKGNGSVLAAENDSIALLLDNQKITTTKDLYATRYYFKMY